MGGLSVSRVRYFKLYKKKNGSNGLPMPRGAGEKSHFCPVLAVFGTMGRTLAGGKVRKGGWLHHPQIRNGGSFCAFASRPACFVVLRCGLLDPRAGWFRSGLGARVAFPVRA